MHTRDAFNDVRLHQAPRITGAWCGDELVLLDSATGKYFTLNRVGGRMWELLATSRSATDLAECLSAEFELPTGVDAGTLQRDVMHMLDELRKSGLLVAATPSSSAQSPASIAGHRR
jgi:hypothetical protein